MLDRVIRQLDEMNQRLIGLGQGPTRVDPLRLYLILIILGVYATLGWLILK
jgi:hypothetical protein